MWYFEPLKEVQNKTPVSGHLIHNADAKCSAHNDLVRAPCFQPPKGTGNNLFALRAPKTDITMFVYMGFKFIVIKFTVIVQALI